MLVRSSRVWGEKEDLKMSNTRDSSNFKSTAVN